MGKRCFEMESKGGGALSTCNGVTVPELFCVCIRQQWEGGSCSPPRARSQWLCSPGEHCEARCPEVGGGGAVGGGEKHGVDEVDGRLHAK